MIGGVYNAMCALDTLIMSSRSFQNPVVKNTFFFFFRKHQRFYSFERQSSSSFEYMSRFAERAENKQRRFLCIKRRRRSKLKNVRLFFASHFLMYSDTLNPKHKETHKKEFGFILSLREALCCGLEEGEKSAQQTREALCIISPRL